MEKINNGVVFSNDIDLILKGKNALKFNYIDNGLIIPDKNFIDSLRDDFKIESKRAYSTDIVIVSEEEMIYYMNKYIDIYRGYLPIVSMDEIYIDCDNKNIFSLDSTRMSGQEELVSRLNPFDKEDVINQVRRLTKLFKSFGIDEIILADDVVFSGSVITQVSNLFASLGIKVVGVVAAISTEDAYKKFNKEMKYGLQCGYLMSEDVLDEICERDFYFGIAQSGMFKCIDGLFYKAPYFLPFGDPVARASVSEDRALMFSMGCINRSLMLWEEIEKNSKKTILMSDLPEMVLNTNKNDEVVKILRRVK